MLDVERAERDASTMLADHWNGRLPIDPFKIATRLGIDVFLAQLGPDVSGLIKKEPMVRTVIYVAADEALVRQRFTCAHELGHYVENGERDIVGYVDMRGYDGSERERYANAFGAALLMPREQVQEMRDRGLDLPAMARAFGVSQAAMGFRLRSLDHDARC